MKTVSIWYLSDYEGGGALAEALKSLSFNVTRVEGCDFSSSPINAELPNMLVVDCANLPVDQMFKMLKADSRIQNFQKFIIVPAEKADNAIALSGDLLHVDFISRPFNRRELLILFEKAVLVEQYRHMMKSISREAEHRIETFESLVHIHKNRDNHIADKDKDLLDRMISYEKNVVAEQKKLNEDIREFTALRHKELFDLKSRLKAEELLDVFRHSEMVSANELIKAQQSVLDFSTKELESARNIIKATEITRELSREEAMGLHEQLKVEREKSARLTAELDALRKKNPK
jgi:hypothetical protein